MLIVAFIYSLTSVFDKVVMINSDPYFGSALLRLLPGLFFLGLAIKQRKRQSVKQNKPSESWIKKVWPFLISGVITALAAITINIALTMQIVPYVISIKRVSILLGVIYGGLLFKENHIWQRLLGGIVMIMGVVIILLG